MAVFIMGVMPETGWHADQEYLVPGPALPG